MPRWMRSRLSSVRCRCSNSTPSSVAALDDFCSGMTDSQAQKFRVVIARVCADPSGRRHPQHSYAKPFHRPERYLGRALPAGTKVWELKTNHQRGLFITDEPWIVFLDVRGKRFMTADECPWH